MVEGVHASVVAIETMEEACGRFSRAILERLPEIQSELRRVTEALEEREDELRGEISRLEDAISSADDDEDTSWEQNRLSEAEEELASVQRRQRKVAEAGAVLTAQTKKVEHLSTEHTIKAQESLREAASDIKAYLAAKLEMASSAGGTNRTVGNETALSKSIQNLPALFISALNALGINTVTSVESEDILRLHDAIKEDAPPLQAACISAIDGAVQQGPLCETNLRKFVQEFLDFVPQQISEVLPRLTLSIEQLPEHIEGSYRAGILRLNRMSLDTETKVRRVLFHELAHWLHHEGPVSFRERIKNHFAERTTGENIVRLCGYSANTLGKLDKWWNSYVGRVYAFEDQSNPGGLEIPSRGAEWLVEDPVKLADQWNADPYFRETYLIVLSGFFKNENNNM